MAGVSEAVVRAGWGHDGVSGADGGFFVFHPHNALAGEEVVEFFQGVVAVVDVGAFARAGRQFPYFYGDGQAGGVAEESGAGYRPFSVV